VRKTALSTIFRNVRTAFGVMAIQLVRNSLLTKGKVKIFWNQKMTGINNHEQPPLVPLLTLRKLKKLVDGIDAENRRQSIRHQ